MYELHLSLLIKVSKNRKKVFPDLKESQSDSQMFDPDVFLPASNSDNEKNTKR